MIRAGTDPFPWDAVTAFCLGTLRLTPGAFWALSLRELAVLLKPHTADGVTRAALESLVRQFPDHGAAP